MTTEESVIEIVRELRLEPGTILAVTLKEGLGPEAVEDIGMAFSAALKHIGRDEDCTVLLGDGVIAGFEIVRT